MVPESTCFEDRVVLFTDLLVRVVSRSICLQVVVLFN